MLNRTPVRPLLSIPLDQIRPSSHQARKHFDVAALNALAESMRQEGLIEPVIVRPCSVERTPSPDLGTRPLQYELISGERRLRAAKLLGWDSIEAKVISVISEGEAAAKGLVENLQREGLNPLEEAEGFSALRQLDPKYWTQDRIARTVGKTQGYISQSIGLLTFPDRIQEDISRQIISRGHALELMRLRTPREQLEVARMIPGKLSRDETRQLINSILGRKHKSKNVAILSKSKPAEPAEPEASDPLADVWEKASADLAVGLPGTWTVQYEGERQWALRIEATGNPHVELGAWFAGMAKLFGMPTEKSEGQRLQEALNTAPEVAPAPAPAENSKSSKAPEVDASEMASRLLPRKL